MSLNHTLRSAARPLLCCVFTASVVTGPAAAATRERLTGMPLFPGSTPVTSQASDMKMGLCNYKIETKGYDLPNGTAAATPQWFMRAIPGAHPYPYSAGGQAGIALFSAGGDGMVHVEKSPSERFVPSTLIYYKFTPRIPADRIPFVAKGGC